MQKIKNILIASVLALGLFAGSANAADIWITYAITGDTALPAGLGQMGPTSGTMTIAYESDGALGIKTGISGGSAHAVSLDLTEMVDFNLNLSPLGSAPAVSPVDMEVTGNATLSWAGGSGGSRVINALVLSNVQYQANGTVNCFGTACVLLSGVNPHVIAGSVLTANMTGQQLAIGNSISGGAQIAMTVPFINFITALSTQFTGVEISRMAAPPIPEPGTGLLLGLGLVGLAGVSARKRRQS